MSNEACPELTRLLRIQRHDFINHAQVIHAFLQLGKPDRAMRYIEELCQDPDLLSSVLSERRCMPECVSSAKR